MDGVAGEYAEKENETVRMVDVWKKSCMGSDVTDGS